MIRVLVTAWMSLALNSVTFAQAKPAAPVSAASAPEIKTKPDQARVLTGKVLSVDAKMGRLTLKLTDNKEINLITDSKSTKAALEKLKVGDTARVFEKGGKLIAASPLKAESKTKTAN